MAKRQLKFSVGQRVWEFDINRRVYPKGGGMCIYAEHFRPYFIKSIQPRTYTISSHPPRAVERVGGHERTMSYAKAEEMFVSDQGKEDRIWIDDHRHKVEFKVGCCRDADILRKVAELVGYQPESA